MHSPITRRPSATKRSARRRNQTLTGALAAAFALSPIAGVAQSIDLQGLHEIDEDTTDITYQDLTVDHIDDMDVVRNGEVIGEVEEVLGDENGEVVALVIEHGGNAIGIGEREVVVPIDEVEFPRGRAEVEVSLTDEELADLPDWDDR